MKIEQRIKELGYKDKNLMPKAKIWNKDGFLLIWGFNAAIVFTVFLSIYDYSYQKYNFDFKKIFSSFSNDYYLWGLLIIFIFALTITASIGKKIDRPADSINKTHADYKDRN